MRAQGRHPLDFAATIISAISVVVAGLMVLSILLIVLAPTIRTFPTAFAFDATKWLAGPFDGLFPVRSTDAYVVANWGLAAVVWLAAGQLVALALRRLRG